MKRVVGFLVGLVVLVLAVLAPALVTGAGDGDGADEETWIQRYDAVFDISDNGDLTATETLTVNFPYPGKHGIFRFWDRSDPTAPTARRIPRNIRITLDGDPVQVEMSKEAGGTIDVARIGSPTSTVTPGPHVYVIQYSIAGVLEPGTGDQPTQFYWNLIPSGWAQVIKKSVLTVHLPAPAQDVQCAVGIDNHGPCTVTGAGTPSLQISTGVLRPRTPVTLKTGLDLPTPPPGDERVWTARFDPVLGPSLVLLIIVLLIAFGAAGLGLVAGMLSREPKPQYPLMYAPPDGVGPALAAYIFTERIDRTAYVATLMYAAQQGAIDLDRTDDTWQITDKAGAEGWAGLDPVTSGVAHLLGGPGSTFTASRKDAAAGKRLKSEIDSFEASTQRWARKSGLLVRSGLGSAGGVVVIGALLLALATAVFNPFNMTVLALVPGGFALFAAPLLASGSGTRRTLAGRELWSRVGGFHRVLSTDSGKERFDFSGRQELYTAYIPWAVALGCAQEWASKYRTEMGVEPPVPTYFAAGYLGGTAGSVTSMVDDFSSTVDSAVSSYQATQTSSSSGGGGGGGGFSGGGGGGGGGGGSW